MPGGGNTKPGGNAAGIGSAGLNGGGGMRKSEYGSITGGAAMPMVAYGFMSIGLGRCTAATGEYCEYPGR